MGNGGVIGAVNRPAGGKANGVWTLEEMQLAVRAGTWPVPDPYWSNVVALLHMNGTDGSTTFTDERGHVFTAVGDAQIDTAQSKFGGASGLFDGTGDYVTSDASADFGMGAGDYTIEGWVRQGAVTGDRALCDSRIGGEGVALYGANVSAGRKLVLANNSAIIATSTGTIPVDTWTHVAIARASGTVKGFIGGAQEFSVSDSRVLAASPQIRFGANNSAGQLYVGHLDEWRITVGVARYTATFTPPAAPFPNR